MIIAKKDYDISQIWDQTIKFYKSHDLLSKEFEPNYLEHSKKIITRDFIKSVLDKIENKSKEYVETYFRNSIKYIPIKCHHSRYMLFPKKLKARFYSADDFISYPHGRDLFQDIRTSLSEEIALQVSIDAIRENQDKKEINLYISHLGIRKPILHDPNFWGVRKSYLIMSEVV